MANSGRNFESTATKEQQKGPRMMEAKDHLPFRRPRVFPIAFGMRESTGTLDEYRDFGAR
jgi:hypothetical protein